MKNKRKRKVKKWIRKVDNKMRAHGDTDYGKRVIRVNKEKAKKDFPATKNGKGELLDTIVHEEQHKNHPKLTEKQVRNRTKKLIARMSKKQKSKMYSRYS